MASVTIRKVEKYFGTTHVIRGVSVDIADGEFCVLVGPSGCGKSTLLRMIAGLEQIGEGEIDIGGRVVNDVPPKERDIAMVFQNYALYPHMTVRDNMAFSLMLAKRPKSEIEERVRKAGDILGLQPYLDRYPRQLSGGQRQRVAMGRAIVRNPQVFLFDEPLSNLDAKLRVQMRTEIKELHQRLRTTSIYVTHDQIEAMTMADKIVVLKDGIVEQIGTPLELYDKPANTFVAGFIGSPAMNFLPGTFKSDGGSIVEFQGGIRVPAPANAGGKDGQQVLYGIRPEHFALTDTGGMAGDIVVVEPTGADTQVFCRIAGQEVMAMFRDRVASRPGERIALMPDLAKAHLFDAQSGAPGSLTSERIAHGGGGPVPSRGIANGAAGPM
ncbi:MAG: sn-glycerol-3-phosphate ABC transporter ATP-binding protein UgpC [Betaproteobacteria bacterium]|nr:sn-glycerol-3-phosphate ABC transporter ATP-binding protein UgpC [Betaproteobacteria bacterium]